MSSQLALFKRFAAGILTCVALAMQTPAAGAMREPWVHSEASEGSNLPAHASPRSVQVPAGTILQVRLNQPVSTAQNRRGHRFSATLAEPVQVNGKTVMRKGAKVTGVVEEAVPSGRLKGRAQLMLALQSVQVNGRTVALSTSAKTRAGQRHRKRNALWIGGASGAGALIGGLAGGPAGMAIGAGSGAAAGVAGAAATGKKQVSIPAETLLTFRLREPVRVPLTAASPAVSLERQRL